MNQEQLVDRTGAKAPPDSEKPKAVRKVRAVWRKGPPTRSAWLKPLDAYDRRERCEFQVARFG
jgi:hypothetical protein